MLFYAAGMAGVPDRPLEPLAQALDEVATCLQKAGLEHPGLMGRIRGAQQGLRAAAHVVSESAFADQLPALRGPVTAISGWTRVLDPALNPEARARALAAIDRNVALLLELLGRLPR